MNERLIRVDGKFYKKSKVVMLPTTKASKIVKEDGVLKFNPSNINVGVKEYQHLYFLADEKIKEGDIVLHDFGMGWEIENPCDVDNLKSNTRFKIIATTDESLKIPYDGTTPISKDWSGKSLPRPSNDFLKKFCEVGGIWEVLVEYEPCRICKDTKRFIVAMFGETDCYYCQKIEGYEKYYKFPKLKVAPDNTISIKPRLCTGKCVMAS